MTEAATGGRASRGRADVTRSRAAVLATVLIAALALSACAAGPNDVARSHAPHLAGFWLGLWHGIICPVTFVISLFTDRLNIYDVHNNGN